MVIDIDKGGEDIPLAARIIAVAVAAESYQRVGGVNGVLEMLANRSGTLLDPNLCTLLQKNISTLLNEEWHRVSSYWQVYLDSEPGIHIEVNESQLGPLAEAFADYTDQKSGWLLGHSHQVAKLAVSAASDLGYSDAECEQLRLAALLHDIGRAGVANGIWDKTRSLTPMEKLKAESHSFYTEMVLSVIPGLQAITDIATAAHERIDGSGYHRRRSIIDPRINVLATADIFNALTHSRPWREALSTTQAADILFAESKASRLSTTAVDAILAASGHGKKSTSTNNIKGLTAREIEVLKELARGLTTKAIAKVLEISPKTVDHHIQRIYTIYRDHGRQQSLLF